MGGTMREVGVALVGVGGALAEEGVEVGHSVVYCVAGN